MWRREWNGEKERERRGEMGGSGSFLSLSLVLPASSWGILG